MVESHHCLLSLGIYRLQPQQDKGQKSCTALSSSRSNALSKPLSSRGIEAHALPGLQGNSAQHCKMCCPHKKRPAAYTEARYAAKQKQALLLCKPAVAGADRFFGRSALPSLLQLDHGLCLLMPPQVMTQLVLGQQLLASKPQGGSGRIQLIIGMLCALTVTQTT